MKLAIPLEHGGARAVPMKSHTAVGDHRSPRRSPGGPGIEPRWAHGAKLAVGTACSRVSRVWHTLDAGCVTEVYYPTIDTPQIHDLQFLFPGGETVFPDELRGAVVMMRK